MIISLYYYFEDKSFDYLSCRDLICERCRQDHSFRPSFEDVKTSIDIIPELLARRKKQSLECIPTMNRNRGAR
jgi:hypothetical protein